MGSRSFRLALAASLALHAAVTAPALVLLLGSSSIRSVLYQDVLAPRFGEPQIVFIGDSLTQYAGIWAFRIGRYDLNTWNLGQSGLTTRQILHSQARRIAARRPKIAFLMAGINDEDKSPAGADASFAHYREMLDTLRRAGTVPVIQLTLYRVDEPTPDFIDRLNGNLRLYAERNGLSVIDLNRSLSRDRSLLPAFSTDGVHLNEQAYRIWATQVRAVLSQNSAHLSGQ